MESFAEKLIAIAENTIPKSKPGKLVTVWCNSDCKEAIRHRRKAQKRAEISLTAENTEHFRVQRAKCKSYQNLSPKVVANICLKNQQQNAEHISPKGLECYVKEIFRRHSPSL